MVVVPPYQHIILSYELVSNTQGVSANQRRRIMGLSVIECRWSTACVEVVYGSRSCSTRIIIAPQRNLKRIHHRRSRTHIRLHQRLHLSLWKPLKCNKIKWCHRSSAQTAIVLTTSCRYSYSCNGFVVAEPPDCEIVFRSGESETPKKCTYLNSQNKVVGYICGLATLIGFMILPRRIFLNGFQNVVDDEAKQSSSHQKIETRFDGRQKWM
jgi:hypothetical protein